MAYKVTIQDIADALGVSRNTVSKALNNTGTLADATREKVLQKATEMGYKQFSYANITNLTKNEPLTPEKPECGEIALFTTSFLNNSHFASTMLDKFQKELSLLGYSLAMHRILPDELENLQLPGSLDLKKTAGILCIELFDEEYSQMVCDLDIPVLFVDTPANPEIPLKADRLFMDNRSSLHQFIKEMVRRGKTKIGFIGEFLHCHSFFERYMAYRDGMYLYGLECPEEYCIIGNKKDVKHPSSEDYKEYLMESLQKIEQFPDVFICANDFVALDAMQVFKKMGISVPKDVYLCGFDDSQESKLISPSLTTIHIHSQIMGFSAVHLLMSRIREPYLNYRTLHTETSLIYRESTED